jgi:hypothetical protein
MAMIGYTRASEREGAVGRWEGGRRKERLGEREVEIY